MTSATQQPNPYPHIRFRNVDGSPEAHVLETGLAVWEVAWLARFYGGNAEAIARQTLSAPDLIAEGLRYAAQYAVEVDAEIARHTEVPFEELRALLPGIRVVTVDIDASANPEA
jgi:hypothetical protein